MTVGLSYMSASAYISFPCLIRNAYSKHLAAFNMATLILLHTTSNSDYFIISALLLSKLYSNCFLAHLNIEKWWPMSTLDSRIAVNSNRTFEDGRKGLGGKCNQDEEYAVEHVVSLPQFETEGRPHRSSLCLDSEVSFSWSGSSFQDDLQPPLSPLSPEQKVKRPNKRCLGSCRS